VSRNLFLMGVAAGAAGSVAGLWASGMLYPRIRRVQRIIQLHRPAVEVFSALARVQNLPELVRSVASVGCRDDLSLWTAQIEGRQYHWNIEVVRVIPGQMIAWRALTSPEHCGRISLFSRNGSTTLLFELEYLPAPPLLGALARRGMPEEAIDTALRDFTAAIESAQSRGAPEPALSSPKGSRSAAELALESSRNSPAA